MAVILIIAASLGALVLVGEKDGGGDYETTFEPSVGEFVTYKNVDTLKYSHDWTAEYTILSINETINERGSIPCAVIVRNSEGVVQSEYPYIIVFFPDYTSYLGTISFENETVTIYENVVVTKVGTDDLQTPWGERTCTHYHLEWWFDEDEDLWVHNGVVLQDVTVSGGLSGTYIITDTNIPEVTHQ